MCDEPVLTFHSGPVLSCAFGDFHLNISEMLEIGLCMDIQGLQAHWGDTDGCFDLGLWVVLMELGYKESRTTKSFVIWTGGWCLGRSDIG
jgi:hypothetical protein